MGLFERLFPSTQAASFAMANMPLRSPWATTSLSRIVLNDLSGINGGDVSRSVAMKIPAVVRGRALIAGTLSRFPLVLREYPDAELDPAPWMISTNTNESPSQRMLWTIDDLIFSGLSLWAVSRDDNGLILDAGRVSPTRWEVNPDGVVMVDSKPANPDEIIVFQGPQEGLVTIADSAIRASRNMSAAWQQRVESPIPLIELHATDADAELDPAEVDDAIAQYEAARKKGGTAFTPNAMQLITHGEIKADLFVEGRNAERLDWGNYLSIPAALLDGSMSTATLTYSTAEGKRNEFVDYSLSYWANPIEARLSQDDVTPEGTYARFDISWLTSPTQQGTNPASED